MLILRLSSELNKTELLEISKNNGLLLLDPSKIDSLQSITLSEHLTKVSFKNKKNIARSFDLEFLLWLSGKIDISRAFSLLGFNSTKNIVVISFKKITKTSVLKNLKAKVLPINLKKTSNPLTLELISTSRI